MESRKINILIEKGKLAEMQGRKAKGTKAV